jgi:Fe2+ transport system protein FeoA
LEQVAPLGDPISVLVAGYHLSLRLNEAENIVVDIKH